MILYVGPDHCRKFFRPLLKDIGYLSQYSDFTVEGDKSLISGQKRCIVFQVGDKKILIDGSQNPEPSYGMMTKGGLGEYSLLIKLQYEPNEIWDACPIPITSWCFSEKRHNLFRSSREAYLNSVKKYKCGFIGRSGGRYHKLRKPYVEGLDELDNTDCYFGRSRDTKNVPNLKIEEYRDRILQWESGLAPIGNPSKGNDGKCWREIEYAAIGLPMVMEKGRNFWVPLNPYEHYIPIKDNDVKAAVEEALFDKELGARLHNWYQRAASQEGICKTFIEIVNKYL